MLPSMTLPRRSPVLARYSSEVRLANQKELLSVCPCCKNSQPLLFLKDKMVPTRKYVQVNGRVYHDCGSIYPCRLYTSMM
jgi:hypothetical protein